ncbi:hypothetical protein ABW43_03060 [Stenotrophomonas maltophilia]|nr:hypothetical protein ABW43_03060 [Stenotrophomonas maltophilia]
MAAANPPAPPPRQAPAHPATGPAAGRAADSVCAGPKTRLCNAAIAATRDHRRAAACTRPAGWPDRSGPEYAHARRHRRRH